MQAYQGQAPFIKSQDVFKAAISIHPVEARHAAWIRNLAGQAARARRVQPGAVEVRGARRGRRDRLHQVGGGSWMPNIGPMELLIVAVIALIVLGPKRLPDAGKSLGKGLREFKGATVRPRRRRPRGARAGRDPAGRARRRRSAARPNPSPGHPVQTARVRDRWRSVPRVRRAVCVVFALLVLAAPASAAETRYSLANGCYRAVGVPGGEAVRMQATTLGRYLLYRPDGTFVSAAGVASAPESRRRLAGRGDGRHVHADAPERRRGDCRRALRAGDRVRDVPRGRPERDWDAGEGRAAVRPRRRAGRRPHALDDVRVLRRQLPLRPAVARVRDRVGAAGLRVDRRAGRRRGDVPELPQLRQPGAAARHARLPRPDVVERDQPDV